MKKLLPIIILFIMAMLLWDMAVDPFSMSFDFDDGDLHGPIGALVAAGLAGGGLIIGLLALLFVGVVLALVFAGVGVVVVGALTLGLAIAALALIPVLFPVLVPVAIIWYLMTRDRNRRVAVKEATPA